MALHYAHNTTSRLLMALLLTVVMGTPCTSTSTVHLVNTSGWSVEKISLPDERAVYLLFWMEEEEDNEPEESKEADPGEEEEEEEETGIIKVLEEEDVDVGPLVQFKEDGEEDEEERLAREEEEEEEEMTLLKTVKEEEKATEQEGSEIGKALLQGGMQEKGTRDGREGVKEEGSVALSYFVFSSEYPALKFHLPQRNVWYFGHFDFHHVHIPVADVSKNPVPSSWWGRTVKVSSGSTVYWYVCPTPKRCDPGNPKNLLQVTNPKPKASKNPSSMRGVDRAVVGVLGAACGVLLPACLGLLAMVIMLKRKRYPQATSRHPPHSCSCRTSPQRRYSGRH